MLAELAVDQAVIGAVMLPQAAGELLEHAVVDVIAQTPEDVLPAASAAVVREAQDTGQDKVCIVHLVAEAAEALPE